MRVGFTKSSSRTSIKAVPILLNIPIGLISTGTIIQIILIKLTPNLMNTNLKVTKIFS